MQQFLEYVKGLFSSGDWVGYTIIDMFILIKTLLGIKPGSDKSFYCDKRGVPCQNYEIIQWR